MHPVINSIILGFFVCCWAFAIMVMWQLRYSLLIEPLLAVWKTIATEAPEDQQ